MKLKRRWLSLSAAGLVTVALFAGGNAPLQGAPRGETVYPTTRSVTPVVGGGDLSSGHALPPAVRERKYELLLERRAELAARQTFPVPDSSGEQAGHPTEVGTAKTRVHGNVNEFVIGRNNENTLADDAGVGSALAEPSAANDGVQVFYTGNTFASFSINGGSTWTKVAIPAGPASSPAPCCDQEVLYDQGRAITLWSVLYARDFDADDDFDNGNIRIIVRREIPAANSCSYVIDPDGANDNVLPDFPHMAVSDNFLYLATNEITNGTNAQVAKVRRFNLDNITDCVTAATQTFSFGEGVLGGPRVFRPIEGAHATMYFGALVNTTTFRLFRWPETALAGGVVAQNFTLANASVFGDATCAGGTNNTDYWDDLASDETGFTVVGAVGADRITFLWDSKDGGTHTQGHIHGIVIKESNLTKVSEPVIFNNDFCFGFPTLSTNERGNLGLSAVFGGDKDVGTEDPPTGFVGIDDDKTTGFANFQTVLVAAGTHGPNNLRWGDYFTVHPHEPCDLFWVATNYALNGGTGTANVDAKYVEFGRGRDRRCYIGWRDETRIP